MCPRLTELTIVCPPSLEAQATAFKAMTGAFRSAYSAISKLITVCSALSDFDTLQIVYFLVLRRYKVWGCGELWSLHELSIKQDQASREHMECVRDRAVGQCAHDWLLEYTKGLAIERWKKRETRGQEGEEWKGTTLSPFIKLARESPRSMFCEGSVEAKEYDV